MNIVFVSDAIYPYNKGGKEKRLYELSTRLAKLGHEVHIYTMHWWQTPELDRIEDGVTLHAISKLYPMYSGDRRSIKEGLLFALACFKLRTVDFEILDVDSMPFFPIFSCWLVCLVRRKKFYAEWHEALSRKNWIDYMGTAGNIAAIIERIAVQLPHTIIAGSERTNHLILQELHRARRVVISPSGIDTKFISSINPAKINCDVLYTGRLVKDKNIDKLVAAMAIIVSENPKTHCVIVGHGIEKPVLQKQIKKLKLEKNVSLVDPLPDASEVYGYMKAASVFCMPTTREGFGIVALEALACGTPVITTDSATNASKDLIHVKNGSVINLTVDNLVVAIQYWLSRPKPKGIAKQVVSYDWDNVTSRLTEIYAI